MCGQNAVPSVEWGLKQGPENTKTEMLRKSVQKVTYEREKIFELVVEEFDT